jgi:hypothetical protein
LCLPGIHVVLPWECVDGRDNPAMTKL